MTFNLWYRLSEELLKIDDSALSDLFKPYIQRLIAHLSVHCRLDEDTDPVSTFYSSLEDATTLKQVPFCSF